MSISRQIAVTALLVCTAFLTVGTGRATARLAGFGPAAAASISLAPATVATSDLQAVEPRTGSVAADVVEPTPQPTAEPTPEPTSAPAVVPQPVTTPASVVAAPAPTTCPATWFCYPRLGIAGPIVPYTDCSGSTDVGTAIRSYSCLSDHYLMGHAYTQFGRLTQWAAGDVVFAWGQRYTVSGAVTQQSCSTPTAALAPLSMQTSLTSKSCGAVLVVQAR
ncbi:MAG TPA: hypothetical protein VGA62_04155 [Acidimicrobiia bacterium]